MIKNHEKNRKLFTARTSRGWRQQDLADKIGSTSLNISRWEQGKTRPSPYFHAALVRVFGMSEEDLGLTSDAGTKMLSQTSDLVEHLTPIYDSAIPLSPAIPLVGRENDLAHIKEQLCNNSESSVVITALNGLPGVGKTSLAITIAYDPQIRETFADGILWAALGPNPNLPALLCRWASLLGLSETHFAEQDFDQKCQTLRTAIGLRSILLVFDDVWKVSDVLALRVGGPNCGFLFTTRFPAIATHLGMEGAMLISELDTERSLQLLYTLAPEAVHLEEEKMRALARAVGGLPLALTLLGNYLRKHAYSGSTRRIVTALEKLKNAEERLLISEPHVAAEVHPSLPSSQPISLSSIIEVSDHFLTLAARETFYALSVFPPKPESFSEDAALAVADCTPDQIDELLDAGLLENQGQDRYRVHQIIADYARLRLDEPRHVIVMRRLLDYIRAYVNDHAKEYEILEREITLILYALERAVVDDAYKEQVGPLVCTVAPYLLMRGYIDQTERWLNYAYELATTSQNIQNQATVLLFLGEVSQKRGDLSCAKELYKRGKGLAESLKDMALTAAFSHDIGRMDWKMGDYESAETILLEGLTLARTTEQPELICDLCRTLAALYSTLADYEQAEAYAREGLDLARTLSDRERIIALLINLGLGLHSPERAALFHEALLLSREIKSEEKTVLVLTNLSVWYTEMPTPDYDSAEGYAHEALIIARRLGNKERTIWALWALAVALRLQGHLGEAEACIQEAFDLSKEIESPRCMCITLDERGNLELSHGNAEAALLMFQEMSDLGTRQHDAEVQAVSFFGLARTYEQLGEFPLALSFGSQSLTIIKQKKLMQYIERVQKWYESCLRNASGQPEQATNSKTPKTTLEKEKRREALRKIVKAVQQGAPVETAILESGVRVSPSTVYRLLKHMQSEGEDALIDGRHGHPHVLGDEMQTFLIKCCQANPGISSSALQGAIQEQFSDAPSISHLNRIRARLSLSRRTVVHKNA